MCTNPVMNDKRQTPERGVILTGKPHCWLRTIPEIKHNPFCSYLPASTKTDGMSSWNNRGGVKWSLCQHFKICVKTSNLSKTSCAFLPWFWQLFIFQSDSDWKERHFFHKIYNLHTFICYLPQHSSWLVGIVHVVLLSYGNILLVKMCKIQ